MIDIMLKVPEGTDWPVVGREDGTLKLRQGFLEAVADASGLGLDWHHPERPALTEEMLAHLLDQWYAARVEAGYPRCPIYDALIDEVMAEPLSGPVYCERCETHVITIDADGDPLCPRCGLVL